MTLPNKITLPSYVASVAIDPQPTFCEGGGLGVNGGNAIMPKINYIRSLVEKGYYTQDWHPEGHSSFAETHGRKPFEKVWLKDGKIVAEYEEGVAGPEGAIAQTLWTVHGKAGTAEAELHPDLVIQPGDLILKKGTNPLIDSYSCVRENDGVTLPRFPNGVTLPDQLRADGITTVVLSGIAREICAADGACDLADEGFRVIFVIDATAALDPANDPATIARLKTKGVEVITLDQLATYFDPPSVKAVPNANGPKI